MRRVAAQKFHGIYLRWPASICREQPKGRPDTLAAIEFHACLIIAIRRRPQDVPLCIWPACANHARAVRIRHAAATGRNSHRAADCRQSCRTIMYGDLLGYIPFLLEVTAIRTAAVGWQTPVVARRPFCRIKLIAIELIRKYLHPIACVRSYGTRIARDSLLGIAIDQTQAQHDYRRYCKCHA